LLTKSANYFWDQEAVRENCNSGPSDIKKMIESKERIGGYYKDLDDPLAKASRFTNIGQKRAVGRPSGRNLRTVWEIATAAFPEAHFATFPPSLVERCVKAGTKIGDIVFDPFLGSGTTCLVAAKLGRDSMGIELNPKYVEMAEKRIRNEMGMLVELWLKS
jgi:DNA modification methylase